MYELQAYILLMMAVIAVVASLVTFYAVRAARRTGQRPLWYLGMGIACIALGSVATGLLYALFDVDLNKWIGFVSTISATGFLILAYSLYSGRTVPPPESG